MATIRQLIHDHYSRAILLTAYVGLDVFVNGLQTFYTGFDTAAYEFSIKLSFFILMPIIGIFRERLKYERARKETH